jgi:hypothetical protein
MKKSLERCRSAGFQPAIPLGSSKAGKIPALQRASRMKTTCLLFLSISSATLMHGTSYAAPELVLCPLPWGEGVPRPAFSPAGAGRVRGHWGPPSQKPSRAKQLPNGRQRSLRGNALHQPGPDKSAGAAKSGLIPNEAVNIALAVRTPSVVRPTAPSFNNVRHRSPNPAVVGGSPSSHSSNTGAINGTRMNRKP